MTAKNLHLAIDTGTVVQTQDYPDRQTTIETHIRAQSLPSQLQPHSTQHTHLHHHHQQVSDQIRTYLDPGRAYYRNRSPSPYRADTHGHGRGHGRDRRHRSVTPDRRPPHEISANALTQKLMELKSSEQTAKADKNQDPEEKQQPPLLIDRTALIAIELQQRGDEVLQDILERLESKKGTLTEIAEAEDSLPDSSEMIRRQHTHKLNPELLKDNHPLQQHHGNANLRHH